METEKKIKAMDSKHNKVNKFTRASRYGKSIYCPNCNTETKVFHFMWFAIMCSKCYYCCICKQDK